MEFLRQLYDWNERTFWNSLTKKLMSFLLLFFIDIGYLAIYFHQKGLIGEELPKVKATIAAQGEDGSTYEQAARLFERMSLAPEYPEFLTLPLYETMN